MTDILNMTLRDLNREKVVRAAKMLKETPVQLDWNNLTAMQRKYLLCVVSNLNHITVSDSIRINNIEL